MGKKLRIACCVLAVPAVLIAGAAAGSAWLIGTESGRSAALSLAVRWVPGFSAESVSGPWDALEIRGISWESPGVSVKLGRAELGLDWRELFNKHLHIARLGLEDAEIRVKTSDIPASAEAESAASGTADLHLPWPIDVSSAEIRNARAEIDDVSAAVGEFSTSAALADGVLTLPETLWSGVSADLPGTAVRSEKLAASGIRYAGDSVRLEALKLAGGSIVLSEAQVPEQAETHEAAEADESDEMAKAELAAADEKGGAQEGHPQNTAAAAGVGASPENAAPAAGSGEPSANTEPAELAAAGAVQTASPVKGFAEAIDAALREPILTVLPAIELPLDAKAGLLEITDWQIEGIPGTKTLAGFSPFGVAQLAVQDAKLLRTGEAAGKLVLESTAGKLDAEFRGTLRDAWPLELSASYSAKDVNAWMKPLGYAFDEGKLALTLEAGGSLLGEMNLSAGLSGAANAELKLTADLTQPYLPFEASLRSSLIQIPKPLPAAASKGAEAQADQIPEALETDGAMKAPEEKADAGKAGESEAKATAENQDKSQAKSQAKAQDAKTASDSAEASVPPADDAASRSLLLESAYSIRDLAFLASGSAKDLHVTLSARPAVAAPEPVIGGEKNFEGIIDIDLSSTLERAEAKRFHIETVFGKLDLEGTAEWPRDLAWSGKLSVEGVDFEPWVKKLPLKLGASAAGSGTLTPAGSFTVKANTDIKGTIAQAPVELRLAGEGKDFEHWQIEDLYFLLGRNTLELKAAVEHLRGVALDMTIKAPGLLNTIPGLRGRADGRVKIDGSLANPKIFADVKAEKLAWEDLFSLDRLSLFADIVNSPFPEEDVKRLKLSKLAGMTGKKSGQNAKTGTAGTLPKPGSEPKPGSAAGEQGKAPPPPGSAAKIAPPPPGSSPDKVFEFIVRSLEEGEVVGKLLLRLDRLTAPGTDIPRFEASLAGRETAHQLKVNIEGDPVAGSASALGNFSRETLGWQGALERAAFSTPAGKWRLAKPAAIVWDPEKQQAEVATHCWEHEDAEICAPKPLLLGRQGEAEIRLTRFSMDVLKPYLRRKSDTLAGSLTGGVRVKWDLDRSAVPVGMADLNGDGLAYSTRWQGVRFPLELERLRAHLLLSEKRAALVWDVKPAGNGSIWGEASVLDPLGERRLEGHFGLTSVTPSLIEPYLSKGEKAEGELNADLRAGGTVAAPELYGRLALENVVVNADFIPIEMEPSTVELNFRGKRSELSGELRALHDGKDESVKLTGEAEWTGLASWKASLRTLTEALHLTIPPAIGVELKADIRAEAEPKSVSVTGTVDVPKVNAEIKELPASSVAVSSDQVLLDADLNPIAAPSEGMDIRANVTVNLGDDVRVSAYGLRARLDGSLRAIMDKGRMGVLGQINVPSGRFRAYGQDLIIQKGTFLFSGPAENPTIRLEAIRNPESIADDVTVGIRVTGTAEEPSVALFSTPSMTDEQALSYLLRGEGLGSSDGSSAAMMTSMLIGLGTSQGGGILSEIGDAVGLSGVGIDTTGSGDDQQVVVSAYVLPGLQVKYGVGIFDSLATLTLRYRLMPRLYLEAVSGVEQALDLLYRFEF